MPAVAQTLTADSPWLRAGCCGCGLDFAPGETVAVCIADGAAQHPDCWTWNGNRCGQDGCPGSGPILAEGTAPAPPAPPLAPRAAAPRAAALPVATARRPAAKAPATPGAPPRRTVACPQCGRANPPRWRFCPDCGYALAGPPPAPPVPPQKALFPTATVEPAPAAPPPRPTAESPPSLPLPALSDIRDITPPRPTIAVQPSRLTDYPAPAPVNSQKLGSPAQPRPSPSLAPCGVLAVMLTVIALTAWSWQSAARAQSTTATQTAVAGTSQTADAAAAQAARAVTQTAPAGPPCFANNGAYICLNGSFLAQWRALGGRDADHPGVVGAPLEPARFQNGQWVQRFTYLEMTAADATVPITQVQFTTLGRTEMSVSKLLTGNDANDPGRNCRIFPETRYNLCGKWRAYWEGFAAENGIAGNPTNLAIVLLGYPISPVEQLPDGRRVQWFERARLEQPDADGPITRALLGQELAALELTPTGTVVPEPPTRTPTAPPPFPTETTTPTDIPMPPTDTPVPSSTFLPTDTPITTRTATPKPPTATPQPPTATPHPPTASPSYPNSPTATSTATPKPPTATAKPPTATPQRRTATPTPTGDLQR